MRLLYHKDSLQSTEMTEKAAWKQAAKSHISVLEVRHLVFLASFRHPVDAGEEDQQEEAAEQEQRNQRAGADDAEHTEQALAHKVHMDLVVVMDVLKAHGNDLGGVLNEGILRLAAVTPVLVRDGIDRVGAAVGLLLPLERTVGDLASVNVQAEHPVLGVGFNAVGGAGAAADHLDQIGVLHDRAPLAQGVVEGADPAALGGGLGDTVGNTVVEESNIDVAAATGGDGCYHGALRVEQHGDAGVKGVGVVARARAGNGTFYLYGGCNAEFVEAGPLEQETDRWRTVECGKRERAV